MFMFDPESYLRELISACRAAFGERLLYVGLQGSYLRGEATEDSDIDIMLILDCLTVGDMDVYRGILKQIGHYEKSCGFICGREEMARWNPLEVCHLKHTTKDLYGSLSDYLPDATRADEIAYVKLSLGNLYHVLCHRYIHADREKNAAMFRAACKGLFFILQNLHYLESGVFAATKKELESRVSEEDRAVLRMENLPDGYDFESAFGVVFRWCRHAFERIDRVMKTTVLETERLKIYIASEEDMLRLVNAQTDESLAAAYREMLQGALANPDRWAWYAVWMITLKDGTHVGDLSFKGLEPDGAAEIGYGVYDAYRENGFAAEAVGAAVSWALCQPGVTRVEAETEPGNAASQRVLEKCGFIPTGTAGEEGPRYVKYR